MPTSEQFWSHNETGLTRLIDPEQLRMLEHGFMIINMGSNLGSFNKKKVACNQEPQQLIEITENEGSNPARSLTKLLLNMNFKLSSSN